MKKSKTEDVEDAVPVNPRFQTFKALITHNAFDQNTGKKLVEDQERLVTEEEFKNFEEQGVNLGITITRL